MRATKVFPNRAEQSDGFKLVREIQHLVHNFFPGRAIGWGLWEGREWGMGVIVLDMGSADVFSRGIPFVQTGAEASMRFGSLIGVTVDWILRSIEVELRRVNG